MAATRFIRLAWEMTRAFLSNIEQRGLFDSLETAESRPVNNILRVVDDLLSWIMRKAVCSGTFGLVFLFIGGMGQLLDHSDGRSSVIEIYEFLEILGITLVVFSLFAFLLAKCVRMERAGERGGHVNVGIGEGQWPDSLQEDAGGNGGEFLHVEDGVRPSAGRRSTVSDGRDGQQESSRNATERHNTDN